MCATDTAERNVNSEVTTLLDKYNHLKFVPNIARQQNLTPLRFVSYKKPLKFHKVIVFIRDARSRIQL